MGSRFLRIFDIRGELAVLFLRAPLPSFFHTYSIPYCVALETRLLFHTILHGLGNKATISYHTAWPWKQGYYFIPYCVALETRLLFHTILRGLGNKATISYHTAWPWKQGYYFIPYCVACCSVFNLFGCVPFQSIFHSIPVSSSSLQMLPPSRKRWPTTRPSTASVWTPPPPISWPPTPM